MKSKLLSQIPNLKINLFVLLLSLLMSNFSYSDSSWCGDIETIEFTNGQESTQIENNGSYNISDLPANFYVNVDVDG